MFVRVLATRAGTWKWISGSTPHDAGLAGKSGSFEATAWSEVELAANFNRRGMIVASQDGRGLEYADGTPYFLIGDTWWSVPSYRFPLALPDNPQPLGPNATLNDLTHHRLKQGYNCVGMIAAQPGWAATPAVQRGHPVGQLQHLVQQCLGLRGRLLGGEQPDVDATADDLALEADQQRPRGPSPQVLDRRVEQVLELGGVEVQRGSVDGEHGQSHGVPLQPDLLRCHGPAPYTRPECRKARVRTAQRRRESADEFLDRSAGAG